MTDLVEQIDAMLVLAERKALTPPVPHMALELLTRARDALCTPAAPVQAEGVMRRHPAYFTFDQRAWEEQNLALYYFAPVERASPPYLEQRRVEAIIDISADGRLAGVELIDNMPLPPLPPSPASNPVKEG